ncbi:PREDICTED: alkane hydroxylase MAH1-like [Tarenaya hassleriana]|uniref:alkane hydroxylase MAH1-like n=1 Tax=Tarenaya hassleriana TaxID=28532 RepID=UPI0008FD454E|nr:PREDICTED: alkane hydroxylase MAH1-like [Tarenaya hassleriana]
MALIGFLEVSAAFISFLIFRLLLNKKTHHALLTDWPFLGMLPGLLVEIPRLYDWSVDVLEATAMTLLFKGPLFSGTDLLFTSDPANIRHVLSSNFANYPKGPEFKKIFDVLGDGIFNSDFELWKNLRRSAHSLLSRQDFQKFTLSSSESVVKNGLLPLLDQAAEKNIVVDLQDVFQRYTFDTTLILATGHDPKSLSIEMPRVEFGNAVEDAGEVVLYRHLKPIILWKLQHWLGFGVEKKMRNAITVANRECMNHIRAKREEKSRGIHSEGEAMDLLSYYMEIDTTQYDLLNPSDDKFLRDTILSFMVAGRDTTSSGLTWFFWLLSRNPKAMAKVRQEISTILPRPISQLDKDRSFNASDLNNLVYLHGAVCETLRLYPPVPFQHKSPAKADVLPSGHRVEANSKIVLSYYALGRMRSVWGDDASDFKPERWISDSGGSRHEPSFKFAAFNAGPRTCLGKQVALMQMKVAALEILENFDITAIEGQKVELVPSVILRMKHGFKAVMTKRRKT